MESAYGLLLWVYDGELW